MIGLPLFSWLLQSGLDRQLLTRVLSETTGMQVSFDSYTLSRSGQAELGNLRVRVADQEFLKARSLRASFSWWSLLLREPELSGLALEAPELTVSDTILDELRNRPATQAPQLSVTFHDAKVAYQDEKHPITLTGLEGSLTGQQLQVSSGDDLSGTITWDELSSRYQLESLSLQLLGSVTGCTFPAGQVELDIQQQDRELQGEVAIDSPLFKGRSRVQLTTDQSGIGGSIDSEELTVLGYRLGNATVAFSWDGTTLALEEALLETELGDLQVNGSVSERLLDLAVTREELTLRLSGERPEFILSAFWDGTSIIDGTLTTDPWTLQVANLNGGYLMRKRGLDGVGFDFEGQLVYQDGLSGKLTSKGGKLRGQTLGRTTLELVAETSEQVSLAGSTMVAKHPVTFEAHLAEQSWRVSAKGRELPAALFRPGLGGHIDLTARTSYPAGEKTFEFSYTGDEILPAVIGQGRLADDSVEFQELKLPKMEPPLVAAGSYGLSKGSLDFQAELKGQQVGQLWSESPVRGRLSGQASLKGTADAPKPSFVGEMRNTIWRDSKLGTVAITADKGTLKATLAEVSLEAVPGLQPHLSGSGTVQLEGVPPTLHATANFPQVAWQGQNLGRLQAKLSLDGETLQIDSLKLPNIIFSGSISEKSVRLKGKIEKLDLSRLPLPHEATGTASGTMTVSGTPAHPNGRFQGSVQKLVYQKTALGDMPLKASLADGVVRAQVLGLAVEQLTPVANALPDLRGVLDVGLVMGKQPKVEGRLVQGTYRDIALPPISATLLYSPDKVNIHRLTLEHDTPVTLTGSFSPQNGTFQLSSRLERVNLNPVLALLPDSATVKGSVSGHLTAEGGRSSAKLNFDGSGQEFAISGVSVGTIPKLNLRATSGGSFTLKAGQLPARGIEPLRGLYPELQGLANFQAVRDPESGTLALSGGLTESNLPDLSFQAKWNGSELKLNSMKANLKPPVLVSGVVKNGQLDLTGELKGQAMSELVRLGGAKPSAEIRANLAGRFKLVGPLKNPTATLVGPISELVYRNSRLGNGHLSLTINQRLKGDLKLDQPYDATLADAAPGSVTQVPVINDILKSAVKARITAVKISGTPADPQVSPVVVGVGVANKIQLPTEVNLPDIQTQLPEVLEQTGVKIPVLQNGGQKFQIPVLQNGGAKIQIPGTGQSIKINTGF
jgi:hypothetical protein